MYCCTPNNQPQKQVYQAPNNQTQRKIDLSKIDLNSKDKSTVDIKEDAEHIWEQIFDIYLNEQIEKEPILREIDKYIKSFENNKEKLIFLKSMYYKIEETNINEALKCFTEYFEIKTNNL